MIDEREPGLTYDRRARAIYVYLPRHPRTPDCVSRTVTTGPGTKVMLDYDRDGELIGIEVLV